MIHGLQMAMRAEDLSRRMLERIVAHEATLVALDARLLARADDTPYTVREEDGLMTLEELQEERQQFADRLTRIKLLRDNLIPGQVYVVSTADLRRAEVIGPNFRELPGVPDDRPAAFARSRGITGLKLTFSGEELQQILKEGIETHERRTAWWKNKMADGPGETDEELRLPHHMCEFEAKRHEWRAEVLGFIRDHLEPFEVYRLGEADLAFGELLPEKPSELEQNDYEERTRISFSLERIAKSVDGLAAMRFVFPGLGRHGENDVPR